jgi:hypothetical protein
LLNSYRYLTRQDRAPLFEGCSTGRSAVGYSGIPRN